MKHSGNAKGINLKIICLFFENPEIDFFFQKNQSLFFDIEFIDIFPNVCWLCFLFADLWWTKTKSFLILLIKKSVNNYGLPSGFERLVKVLEGKNSNYETSLFTPLTEYLENANGKKMKFLDCEDVDKQAFQTLLDHMRCLSVAITGTTILLVFPLLCLAMVYAFRSAQKIKKEAPFSSWIDK